MSLDDYKARAAELLKGTNYVNTLQRVMTKEGLLKELRRIIGALSPVHWDIDHLKVLCDLLSVSVHCG